MSLIAVIYRGMKMASKYSLEAGCSCLDSAYERKAIDDGMNHNPVFPENKEYLLRIQCDELLASLKELLPAYRKAVGLHGGQDDAFTVRAHNAIARSK